MSMELLTPNSFPKQHQVKSASEIDLEMMK